METAVTRGPRPRVQVFKDPEMLSHAAAKMFVSLSQETIALRTWFTVVLSGGTTPRRFYSLLGLSPYRSEIDWKRVHVFWADERCVPRDHPESNFKLAFDAFLSNGALPDPNIHRIRGEEGAERAAEAYEEDIRSFSGSASFPVFDLIILGAGEDGHTASLFPGGASVREKTRFAVPVYLEPPKLNRVTLTLPVLNSAVRVLFFATGHPKAGVVHEIVENGNPRQYPAGLVQPIHGSVTWMIDREAAGSLTSNLIPKY